MAVIQIDKQVSHKKNLIATLLKSWKPEYQTSLKNDLFQKEFKHILDNSGASVPKS